jgi:hypothetical protein
MTNAYRPTTDRVHEQVALYEGTEGREGGTLEGRAGQGRRPRDSRWCWSHCDRVVAKARDPDME